MVTLGAVVLCVLFAVTTMNVMAIPLVRIEIAAQTSIACSTQKNKWKNAFVNRVTVHPMRAVLWVNIQGYYS